ncbi:MAG: hypothetical protein PHU23_13605 [Dehalococcoidales bacterium]|nr:hypothetical protein [Dehalococcoidales bacterium]
MATYAQIVEIVAPAQAYPGNKVDITVKVKNLYASVISLMVGGALEYGASPWPEITYPQSGADVDGGVTYSFNGYFYMPDKSVTIHAYSYWYGGDGYWHLDDEKTKGVNIGALTPLVSEFKITDFAKV